VAAHPAWWDTGVAAHQATTVARRRDLRPRQDLGQLGRGRLEGERGILARVSRWVLFIYAVTPGQRVGSNKRQGLFCKMASANLQQAPDGQRYGPGAIASGEERFRSLGL
jgi:hypothetical protein